MKSILFILGAAVVTTNVVSGETRLTPAEYQNLRDDITQLAIQKRCAPILVRLAWHDAGTYDAATNTGGPHAAMRFDSGESTHGANAGLDIARGLLADIEAKYKGLLSVADLWALAGTVAVEAAGGPSIPFRFGRTDADSPAGGAPEGRLPDGDKGLGHLRNVFHRMGFNDAEIVTLSGAHTLGSCHHDRSGFEGPWTTHERRFDNEFYTNMIELEFKDRINAQGLKQKMNDENEQMMLLTDMALLDDPQMKRLVETYAKDEHKFFVDFAEVFQKLVELGYSDDQLITIKSSKDEL